MNFDTEDSVRFWTDKNLKESVALAEKLALGREVAARLAEALKTGAQVSQVILFGSLAEAAPTRSDFDIDLAIKGGNFLRALRLVRSAEFPVDLVDYEDLPEHVRLRVDQSGVLL